MDGVSCACVILFSFFFFFILTQHINKYIYCYFFSSRHLGEVLKPYTGTIYLMCIHAPQQASKKGSNKHTIL